MTRIGSFAFFWDDITSVSLPAGITSIGEAAFSGCPNLSSVNLPAGLRTIGDGAFAYTALSGVLIPPGVTSIGGGAFSGTALTSVTIPAGVASIGAGAFADCYQLQSIVVDPANAVYSSANGMLFDAGGTALLQYPAGKADVEFTIPAGVEVIGGRAFSGCSTLTGVTLPDGVTTIESEAFITSGLAEIAVPDSVASIGDRAFYSCGSLSSAVIGNGVTSIGIEAFASCPVLADVTLPEGLTAISDGMFWGCGLLYNPVIPTTVTSIGANAFRDCDGITAITLPASVSTIGNLAFRQCDALEQVILSEGLTAIGEQAFSECTLLSDIAIPSTVTSIGTRAFLQCPKLARIEIPGSVASIGEQGFFGCRGLTEVVVGEGIATIPPGMFRSCDSLTDVALPDSLETIGNGAFESCSALTSIVLNEGLSTIGVGAFSGSGLTFLRIPASVTTIATFISWVISEPFGGCPNLTAIEVDASNPAYASVDGVLFSKDGTQLLRYPAGRLSGQFVHYAIPDTVTTIAAGAFRFTDNLLSVSIPAGVAELGGFAFDGCLNLQRVYFGGDAPSADGDSFQIFQGTAPTLYYLPGTAGWTESWQGRPAVQWDPRILPDPGTFGIHGGHFGFTLSAAAQVPVVIEACSDPAVGDWTVIDAVVCDTDGIAHFSDPEAADAPSRIYRFRPE